MQYTRQITQPARINYPDPCARRQDSRNRQIVFRDPQNVVDIWQNLKTFLFWLLLYLTAQHNDTQREVGGPVCCDLPIFAHLPKPLLSLVVVDYKRSAHAKKKKEPSLLSQPLDADLNSKEQFPLRFSWACGPDAFTTCH